MEPLTRKEFFLNAIAEGTPTPPPLTREERYLAKIAENTGGLVPPIEEGDDGKVLTASDGAAVWASGGGGITTMTLTYNEGRLVAPLTTAEIIAALQSGVVVSTYESETRLAIDVIVSCDHDKDSGTYYFNAQCYPLYSSSENENPYYEY